MFLPPHSFQITSIFQSLMTRPPLFLSDATTEFLPCEEYGKGTFLSFETHSTTYTKMKHSVVWVSCLHFALYLYGTERYTFVLTSIKK